jgi:hypothetical protein
VIWVPCPRSRGRGARGRKLRLTKKGGGRGGRARRARKRLRLSAKRVSGTCATRIRKCASPRCFSAGLRVSSALPMPLGTQRTCSPRTDRGVRPPRELQPTPPLDTSRTPCASCTWGFTSRSARRAVGKVCGHHHAARSDRAAHRCTLTCSTGRTPTQSGPRATKAVEEARAAGTIRQAEGTSDRGQFGVFECSEPHGDHVELDIYSRQQEGQAAAGGATAHRAVEIETMHGSRCMAAAAWRPERAVQSARRRMTRSRHSMWGGQLPHLMQQRRCKSTRQLPAPTGDAAARRCRRRGERVPGTAGRVLSEKVRRPDLSPLPALAWARAKTAPKQKGGGRGGRVRRARRGLRLDADTVFAPGGAQEGAFHPCGHLFNAAPCAPCGTGGRGGDEV